jgi:LPS export ABC transporter protein LptC
MRIPFRVVAVTAAFAGMILLGGRLLVGADRQPSATGSVSSAPGPDASIQRVRITETRKGDRLWDVEADRAELFEERGLAILTRVAQPVRIVIYHGTEMVICLADKAVVNLRTKDLQLIGQVRLESNKGTRIFSELLNWSAEHRQITTDGPVLVEREGIQIRGKGMVVDAGLERMAIRERVASEITLSGKGGQR